MDGGGAGEGMVARQDEGACAGLEELHRAGERAGTGEGVVLGGIHGDRAGLEGAGKGDGAGVVAGEIEADGVACGEGGCRGGGAVFPRGGGAGVPGGGAGAAFPDELGADHGRRRRRGHSIAEVVVDVAGLHVALGGRLDAILGVVHQGVDAEGGAVVGLGGIGGLGGVDAELGVVGGDAEQLLAPVAEDVAPELGTAAVGDVVVVGGIRGLGVAVEGEKAAAGGVGGIEFIDTRAGGGASDGGEELAAEVAVPPDGLGREGRGGVDLVALGVVGAAEGGEHLEAGERGDEGADGAAADVDDAAGVEFFDDLALVGGVVGGGEAGAVVLLDQVGLEARAGGVDVGDVVAVAVDDLGDFVAVDLAGAVGLHDHADVDVFVGAVVVHVGETELVALGGVLVRGLGVPEPAERENAAAVVPGGGHVVEAQVGVAVFAVEEDRGPLAVGVDDAHVGPEDMGAGGPAGGDGDDRAGFFRTGESVDDRDILHLVVGRDQGGRGRGAGVEDDAVGGADGDLGFAVAVEIIDHDAVGLTDGDGRGTAVDVVLAEAVGPHVHLPEEGAVALVGLEPLGGGDDLVQAVDHEVEFAVAVEIADPAELHVVVGVGGAGRGLERDGEILARGGVERERIR